MAHELSPNAKAILLLTAPLMAGRNRKAAPLLTPGEYQKLAAHLHKMGQQPADLIAPESGDSVSSCEPVIPGDRLQALLSRGLLLSQAVERWRTRAIWVVSRADPEYPQRLKSRLKGISPAVLYGCGDRQLLESGGLAVVGSRKVNNALVEYTEGIGQLVAQSHRTLVSGGAKGIDQAAMRGALQEGGRVTGVLSDSLEKTAMTRDHRDLILNGQLALVSPFDPRAGFNVGNAMQRNKLIYALADAALVVNSDAGKGGTWAGAHEQLKRLFFVPVFVRSTGEPSDGLRAIEELGALRWPNPSNADELTAALAIPPQEPPRTATQPLLNFTGDPANSPASGQSGNQPSPSPPSNGS